MGTNSGLNTRRNNNRNNIKNNLKTLKRSNGRRYLVSKPKSKIMFANEKGYPLVQETEFEVNRIGVPVTKSRRRYTPVRPINISRSYYNQNIAHAYGLIHKYSKTPQNMMNAINQENLPNNVKNNLRQKVYKNYGL